MSNPHLFPPPSTLTYYEDTSARNGEDEAPTSKASIDEASTVAGVDEAPSSEAATMKAGVEDEAAVTKSDVAKDPPAKAVDDETPAAAMGNEDDASHAIAAAEEEASFQDEESEGSVDGDMVMEDPIYEEVVEAGPSGEQLPVVFQQAVCGGDDPPEMSEYEKLRERNIRERDEAMKEAMEEIEEAK